GPPGSAAAARPAATLRSGDAPRRGDWRRPGDAPGGSGCAHPARNGELHVGRRHRHGGVMHVGTVPALLMLATALLFDALFGEYPSPVHPVVWIGTIVKTLLRPVERAGSVSPHASGSLFVYGALLALGVPAATFALALLAVDATAPWAM